MRLNNEECQVYCTDCNGYLYSVSIYEVKNQSKSVAIKCPHRIQKHGIWQCKYGDN